MRSTYKNDHIRRKNRILLPTNLPQTANALLQQSSSFIHPSSNHTSAWEQSSMAFYYDNRYGDIIYSGYEFYGGNLQWPPEYRQQVNENAIFNRLVNDWPNIYGDCYEHFKAAGANMNDYLWKRDEFKEVRAARGRGDRSDKSIWPQMGYGGGHVDWWGNYRDCSAPGAVTRISEPLFGGNPMDPWSYTMQPGDQMYYCGWLLFYPY
jgi:hypothetical protein